MSTNSTVSAEVASNRPGAVALRRIRSWIEQGRLVHGDRLPTEQELASRLNVARVTVRSALKNLEDNGLIRTEGRGRVVTAGATENPGMMADTAAILADDPSAAAPQPPKSRGWHQVVQAGVTDAIEAAGLHTMILRSRRIAGEQVRRLIADPPYGVIALQEAVCSDAGREVLHELVRQRIAVVGYGFKEDLSECDTVNSDHETGAYELTKWLIGRGCRRIVRFWTTENRNRPPWYGRRDAGYERALHEAGLQALPAIEVITTDVGGEGRQRFELAARVAAGLLLEHLTGSHPIDAVMCASDGLVPQVAAACRLLGKRPQQDVAIVGYDNYWSETPERAWEPTPPLATVDKQNLKFGEALVEMLLARREGKLPPDPQHRLLKPELVVIGDDQPVSGWE